MPPKAAGLLPRAVLAEPFDTIRTRMRGVSSQQVAQTLAVALAGLDGGLVGTGIGRLHAAGISEIPDLAQVAVGNRLTDIDQLFSLHTIQSLLW